VKITFKRMMNHAPDKIEKGDNYRNLKLTVGISLEIEKEYYPYT
jgi:hypothetical protein